MGHLALGCGSGSGGIAVLFIHERCRQGKQHASPLAAARTPSRPLARLARACPCCIHSSQCHPEPNRTPYPHPAHIRVYLYQHVQEIHERAPWEAPYGCSSAGNPHSFFNHGPHAVCRLRDNLTPWPIPPTFAPTPPTRGLQHLIPQRLGAAARVGRPPGGQ